MFYIFSTHEDQTLRSLGQWLYWTIVVLIWLYLLAGVFVVPSTEADNVRLQQGKNIIMLLMFGMITWEMMLFSFVLTDADNHAHLSRTYIYIAAGMQSMAYAFVVMSIILSIAKQAVDAAMNPKYNGQGTWVEGPMPRDGVSE